MEPITALMLAQGIGGAAKAWESHRQGQMASRAPTLAGNQNWNQYADMIRGHATTGPLTGSQQANMRRELFSQYNPQFNIASQNIQQRGTAQGLENSAVVSQQQAGVDVSRANTMAQIARRIAMQNEEMKLQAVNQLGGIGRAEYGSALSKFQGQMPYAGGVGASLLGGAAGAAGAYGQTMTAERLAKIKGGVSIATGP